MLSTLKAGRWGRRVETWAASGRGYVLGASLLFGLVLFVVVLSKWYNVVVVVVYDK